MRNVFALVLAVIFLSEVVPVEASQACGEWLAPEAGAKPNEYPLELRSCDLTGGISAFLQFQNSSSHRLKLTYRVTTNDEAVKESQLEIEPGLNRGTTCVACARRKAGLRSWEILAIESLGEVAESKADSATADEDNPGQDAVTDSANDTVGNVSEEQSTGVAVTPPQRKQDAGQTASVGTGSSGRNDPYRSTDSSSRTDKGAEDEREKGSGLAIPIDQLPPEFRPRH